MARLNEILVGRFNRGLQKLFGIKGSPPVATLAPEIMPVHGLASGTEHRYLEGWARFGFQSFLGGVAANVGGFRLRNPTGSNVIAVVEKLMVSNEAGAVSTFTIGGGAFTVDLGTVFGVTGARLDPRGNPQPTCIVSGQNTTASIPGGTNGVARCALIASSSYEAIVTDDQELPLLPGDAYTVITVPVNTAITVGFLWRERFLEESERT